MEYLDWAMQNARMEFANRMAAFNRMTSGGPSANSGRSVFDGMAAKWRGFQASEKASWEKYRKEGGSMAAADNPFDRTPAVASASLLKGGILAITKSLETKQAAKALSSKSSGEIGKDIVKWGRGQGADDVAQTIGRANEINPKVVQDMIKQGLERGWVEKQLSMYEKAVDAAGKNLTNEQLLPRLELMQNILKNWPND